MYWGKDRKIEVPNWWIFMNRKKNRFSLRWKWYLQEIEVVGSTVLCRNYRELKIELISITYTVFDDETIGVVQR